MASSKTPRNRSARHISKIPDVSARADLLNRGEKQQVEMQRWIDDRTGAEALSVTVPA